MRFEVLDYHKFRIRFRGHDIFTYDGSRNLMGPHDFLYKPNEGVGDMTYDIELFIDVNMMEAFIDDGALYICDYLKEPRTKDPLNFDLWDDYYNIKVHYLEINEMKSIWKN